MEIFSKFKDVQGNNHLFSYLYLLSCQCLWVWRIISKVISQEAGDILLQNNIFTLKIYRNMNSFVLEASGDCPPTPNFLWRSC